MYIAYRVVMCSWTWYLSENLMNAYLLLESESEDSSDDEPLIKKLKKPPTDEELKETVKKLLASANLEEVTMKQICKEVTGQILASFCFYLKNSLGL